MNIKMPLTLNVLDMHTAGEPVRILLHGQIDLEGHTVLEKRQFMKENFDHIRTSLMMEPRGHADMYGAILTDPSDRTCDIGVLFMHHSGYSTMCGHATIALGRYLYDEYKHNNPEKTRNEFRIECPCGPVDVRVTLNDKGEIETEFDSVDCFAETKSETAEITGLGNITYDIAYGGAYYAILPASSLGVDFANTPVSQLELMANKVTEHLRKERPISHPTEKDLSFLYGTILTDNIMPDEERISYNLCVFGEGQVDRSPTGSGVSARMALFHAKGLISQSDMLSFAGISGIAFKAQLCRSNEKSVAVTISGKGYYMSRQEVIIDMKDQLTYGFELTGSFKDVMASDDGIVNS